MMQPGTFEVRNLSKQYATYRSDAHRLLSCLWPSVQPQGEHVVLQGINFSIAPGEALGVIGHNGAGKSTLLKILTGTLQPTTGTVQSAGRVAAILELGMGFDPEMTARQNVLHVGGLMGLDEPVLQRCLPEIEAFAEIGPYFDQPMRQYSSGMQVRVAFALATAVRPDILIVDEALSVGDAYFQHKSFDRIRQFRSQGTTLLFVSHDKSAVLALCDRCLLLNRGQLLMDGDPGAVMDYYNALIAEKESSADSDAPAGQIEQASTEGGRTLTRSGTGEARMQEIALLRQGESVETVAVGETVVLRVRVACQAAIAQLVLGYMIKDRLGQPVFGTNTWHTGQLLQDIQPGEMLEYSFAFDANIGPGTYSVSISLSSGQDHLQDNYEWTDLALVFAVVNIGRDEFVGQSWIPPTVAINRQYAG